MGNLIVPDKEDRQRRTKRGKPSKAKAKTSNKKAILDFFETIKQDEPSTYSVKVKSMSCAAFVER
jgi:hypothetical protein